MCPTRAAAGVPADASAGTRSTPADNFVVCKPLRRGQRPGAREISESICRGLREPWRETLASSCFQYSRVSSDARSADFAVSSNLLRLHLCRFAIARRKFERDLVVLPEHKPGGEWPAGFGDEFFEQFGLAGRQQPGHLRALHCLLQNDLPRTKIARLRRAGRFLADVAHPALEHARAALGAFAERLLAGEVHFRHLAGRI